VNSPERLRAADRIVHVLAEHGIDRVFGIPGGTISPVVDALLDADIEHVTCQHESMAAYAAAGYARATGKPGVVVVTSGPGVLNTMTALAAAYTDENPVVVLAGEVASGNVGKGALQDGSEAGLDIVQMVASVTKYAEVLRQPMRAEAVTRKALQDAMIQPRGPSLLCLPVDVTGASVPSEPIEQIVRGDVAPDDSTCRQIAELLQTAQRPALMVGGAAQRAMASRSLIDLAEWTRCPVFTDLEAKGVFPESHPLSLGIFGVGGTGRVDNYLEGGVDLLITVGARLDDTTTANYSPLLQPQGTLVQLDHDPRRLGRAYAPDLMMASHLPSALERIRSLIEPVGATTLLARDRALREVQRNEPELSALGQPPHDPRAVIRALQQALPDDTVFTSDIGNHLLFAGMHLELDRPDQFHVSMGLGGMTSGIGMAIGLQLAYGKRRRVVCICGDGGMLMGGSELATCARYGIPVTFAVLNDGRLGMVQDGSERVYRRSHDWTVPETDLVVYGKSMGCFSYTPHTLDDLVDATKGKRPGPLLIDISVNHCRPGNPRDATLNFSEVTQ
jgi:acetolactate synthase-1/2/3 large subunit